MPWAIDLGTTNTLVALCDERAAGPRTVDLAGLSLPGGHWLAPVSDAAPPLIPSAVLLEDSSGRRAAAGSAAITSAYPGRAPANLARSFKRWLARGGTAPVARCAWGNVSAALAGEAFLRALLAGIRRTEHAPRGLGGWWAMRSGRWPGEVVIPAPVDSYEVYGREVRRLALRAGFREVRSVEESVAAALGYGLDIRQPRRVLLVDFGGGTLDLAVVCLGDGAAQGRARVLAVAGRELGGETVDCWLCALVARLRGGGMDADHVAEQAGWEVEYAKKRLSAHDAAPQPVRLGQAVLATVERAAWVAELETRGLYRDLAEGVREGLRSAARAEGSGDEPLPPDEALLVGGSTLLPGVAECIAEAAGVRPREWHPFEAVALGAALFAAGRGVDPRLYHDYGVRLRMDWSEPPKYEYERVIPSGSRYPTPQGEEVVRYYAPVPGKQVFSLPVCEIGRFGWSPLPWEARHGAEYWRPADEAQRERVVWLNETDSEVPVRPPSRGDEARLRVAYRVDEQRRLVADVYDLQRKAFIRRDWVLAGGLR